MRYFLLLALLAACGSPVPPADVSDGGLIADPEALNTGNWTTFHTSVTANVTLAPNGTLTAEKVVEDNQDEAHTFFNTVPGVTIASGEQVAVSISVKAGERTKVRLTLINVANGCHVDFDLATGQVIASTTEGAGVCVSSSISPDPRMPGYYRIGLLGRINGGATQAYMEPELLSAAGKTPYLGDGASGAYFWGAMLERHATAIGTYPD